MLRPWHIFVLLFLVVSTVIGSFAAGVFYASYLPSSAQAVVKTTTATPTALESRMALLGEALKLLETDYYKPEALQGPDVVYGAIRGMLQPLGDPYTAFASPRQAAAQNEELSGKFDGIGAVVDLRDGQLTIVDPQTGTPAERTGLKAGDIITHVDGKPTVGLALPDAVALIRGQRGTTVLLTIVRGSRPPFEVAVTRAGVKYQYVRWEMLPDGVAYLRLTTFAEVTRDFVNALRDLKQQRARALVLDLRGNPGGYLEVALDVASQFLEPGLVCYQQERGGERQPSLTRQGGIAGELPLAVLVDRNSASAAEVVAGALQDHGRALLVGERTTGKGSVQRIYTLSDRSNIRVTYAQWLTPKGREIDKLGLEPDVAVAPPTVAPRNLAEDKAVQQAVSLLTQQLVASK